MDKNKVSENKKVFSYWGLFTLFFVFLISLVVLLLVLPRTFAPKVTMEVYSQADGKAFSRDVEVDIFNDPKLNNQMLVHPYSKGSFSFAVYNNSESDMLPYYIEIESENPDQIPLIFSLQKNGQYIYGGNEEVEMELITYRKFEESYLLGKNTDMYTLKWQWKTESDVDDTLIGDSGEQFYKLILRAVGTVDEIEIPQTGDRSKLKIFICLAFVSFLLIILIRFREKKEEDVDLQEGS